MNIWLVRDLDPLPIDGENRRLMRSGMLARTLVERGHAVRWFTSAFDHYRKRLRTVTGTVDVQDRFALEIFPAKGYATNLSMARIAHNRRFAAALIAATHGHAETPDLVLADLPTTEAAQAAVALARRLAVPSVVSIRDLWPDFFLARLPRPLRPLAAPGVALLERQARAACAGATALVGVSQSYLEWGLRKAGRSQNGYDAVFELGYAPRWVEPSAMDTIRDRLGLPEGAVLVSYVGNWGATYDLDRVAEIAHLSGGRADIHFVVAGDPAGRPRLARRFQRMANVTLTGWLGAREIAALLESSHLGLLPYVAGAPQGLPNKVFEYMAHGVYQLATLGGEMAAFLERTNAGVARPGADAKALADAIATLVDFPEIAAGREQRRTLFAARYSAGTIYAAYAAHLEEVELAWKRGAFADRR